MSKITAHIPFSRTARTFSPSTNGVTHRYHPRRKCSPSFRWHLKQPVLRYSTKPSKSSVSNLPISVTRPVPQTGKLRRKALKRRTYWYQHKLRMPDLNHRAFIALGSNTGDRVGWIELALKKLKKKGLVRVSQVSGLWESMPMYVLDQEKFLNAVCVVDTSLEPLQLLDLLQSIENDLGRVKVVDKGPRNIDLDILYYDTQIINHERLKVPHPGINEREFVLRPLSQLSISLNRHHLRCSTLVETQSPSLPPEYWKELNQTQDQRKSAYWKWIDNDTYPVTAVAPSFELLPRWKSHPTLIMAILNLTPDSFSDGGKHFSAEHGINETDLLATVDAFIRDGATIIDVGGQSSRPGAEDISTETEIERTIPKIALIKNHLGPSSKVAISIDTYRAEVARAAVAAGADVINDVSAGLLDKNMYIAMAESGKTVILGHMRGTPQTMTGLTDYGENNEFLLNNIKIELDSRMRSAMAAGVRPWRIILDPGFGFAKTEDQNIHMLKNLEALISHQSNQKGIGMVPWMVGTSRKRFIGNILGVKEPKDRIWGTAATVVMAIQAGACIVRVHDVKEMAQVAKMVDAVRL